MFINGFFFHSVKFDIFSLPAVLIMRALLPLITILLLSVAEGFGQQDSTKIGFTPYASFRGHFAVYDGEMEIQENASRIGFELSVYRDKVRYFAGTELGINLFRSPQLFNADANTNSGFITIDDDQ